MTSAEMYERTIVQAVLVDAVDARDRRIAWLEELLRLANEEIGALREQLAHERAKR